MSENVGILHPGEMGVSIAASAKSSEQNVFWVSEGRGPETYARAQSHSLIDAHSLKELCQTCSIIISICPPHAAEDVARQVLAHSFKGLYVDANAAYTKGTSALLCAILGAAENLGVRPELERQWSHGGSDFADQTVQRVRQVTAKAWHRHPHSRKSWRL